MKKIITLFVLLAMAASLSAADSRRASTKERFDVNNDKNVDVGVTWVFSSGNVGTLSMQRYVDPETGYEISYIEHRNNFRMPAYHRMDVGVNFHKEKKHGIRTLSISVYNLYNRQNPFMVYRSSDYTYTLNGTRYDAALVQLSLFPMIPSISWSFKF